jgi:hypothetical protein
VTDDKVKINFNIDKELWESFKKICKWQDLTASQKLRKFIRDTVLAEAKLSKIDREEIEERLRRLGYIK